MKRTGLIIALALLLAAQSSAKADSRFVKFCGPDHVNEVASEADIRPNPDGYYVASLREQVSEGDPRIVLTHERRILSLHPIGRDPGHGDVEGVAADARTHREVPLRASHSARHTLIILNRRATAFRDTLHQ